MLGIGCTMCEKDHLFRAKLAIILVANRISVAKSMQNNVCFNLIVEKSVVKSPFQVL
jgi:hypothetical protein